MLEITAPLMKLPFAGHGIVATKGVDFEKDTIYCLEFFILGSVSHG